MTDNDDHLDTLVAMALDEDISSGDLTAKVVRSEKDVQTARIVAKQKGVLAGGEAGGVVCSRLSIRS